MSSFVIFGRKIFGLLSFLCLRAFSVMRNRLLGYDATIGFCPGSGSTMNYMFWVDHAQFIWCCLTENSLYGSSENLNFQQCQQQCLQWQCVYDRSRGAHRPCAARDEHLWRPSNPLHREVLIAVLSGCLFSLGAGTSDDLASLGRCEYEE